MIGLSCHPTTPCEAVRGIEVQVRWVKEATLELCYAVAGDIERLRVPEQRLPGRADRLWQHTCFEAFVAGDPGQGYRELNFSPSTEWAIYAFSRYREGMRVVEAPRPPRVSVHRGPGRFTLEAVLDAELLPTPRGAAGLRFALCAVIEAADGGMSYWALAHPASKPDFHRPEGFVLPVIGTIR